MKTEQLLFVVLFAVAMYIILASSARGVSGKMRKAVLAQRRESSFGYDELIPIAAWLSTKIRFSEAEKREWQSKLKQAGLSYTPELYYATAICDAVALTLIFSIIGILFPICFLVAVFVGGIKFKKSLREVDKRLKERRERIDRELPHLVNIIARGLQQSRDIIGLLESYRSICGAELAEEITITLADMKSSNPEGGLLRLGTRLNSQRLSQVVSGLLGVFRGEKQQMYFELLYHDFIKQEREILRKEAQLRPKKLSPFSYILLVLFIGAYIVGMIGQILSTSKDMFGF